MGYSRCVVMLAMCSVVWVCSACAAEAAAGLATAETKETLETSKNEPGDTSTTISAEPSSASSTAVQPGGSISAAPAVSVPSESTDGSTENMQSLSDNIMQHKTAGAVPGAGSGARSDLQVSSDATETPKGNTADPGAGSHQIESQSQQLMLQEDNDSIKSKAGGDTGSRETNGSEIGARPLRDATENDIDTVSGQILTGKTDSKPSSSGSPPEIKEQIVSTKTEPGQTNLKKGTASKDKILPVTLLTDISRNEIKQDDTKKHSEGLQTTSNRPNAQIVTDVSDTTTTEPQVAISQEVLAPTGTTDDTTTTTTVTPPSPGRNVDTKLPLPNGSNALPLHNSVDKTDFSFCSSSLFALAALATLAVAAAAPAH